LVVLTVATNPSPGGYTVGDGLPIPANGAETARKWFAAKGFAVDPLVGISFSINGPSSLFSSVLGLFKNAPGIVGQGAALELDQAALAGLLDADLLPHIAAIVVGPSPDFGPGNP
jgi:hypothetical protein